MKKNTPAWVHSLGGGALTLVCFLLLFATTALAQTTFTVTGKVTDSKNTLLDGASVMIKGTSRGVTTNNTGSFTITNVPVNATLVIGYTGYANKELSTKGVNGSVSVLLSEQALGPNDVVVIGYGTTTKKDFTGSVAQVKSVQLENEKALDKIPE